MKIIGPRTKVSIVLSSSTQRGTFTVEFALVFIIFLMLTFGALELARLMYVFNSVQEITRVAAERAATTDFSDSSALEDVRRIAVFDKVSGKLPAAATITANHVTIDYLSLQNDASGSMRQVPISSGSMPACPARNKVTCEANIGASSCIRLVRVRICEPGTNCDPVPYAPGFPFFPVLINVPTATTIVRAQSLGYTHGMDLCN